MNRQRFLFTRNYSRLEMYEFEQIKDKIAITETRLAEAKNDGDREMVLMYGNQLTEQTGVWKNLVARQGSCEERVRSFLWKPLGMKKDHTSYFLLEGLGRRVLERPRVVAAVLEAVRQQFSDAPTNTASVYLFGCRGMGKTSILFLIAKRLMSEGWEVFWFDSASSIPLQAGVDIREYALKYPQKRIAVVVDEVTTNPNSPLFVSLMKSSLSNVLTIGAAVPRHVPSGGAATFRQKFYTQDLILKESDEDVRELVTYWKTKNVTSPKMVDYVSKFLIMYCGGHVYPVLAFMEFFFVNSSAKEILSSKAAFRKHFCCPELSKSAVYRRIIWRCFDSAEPDSVNTLARVLRGKEETADISTLSNLGWWDPEKREVLSTLLQNHCLDQVVVKRTDVIHLGATRSWEENLEQLIIEGLSAMESDDLNTGKNQWPIENALSFNWACRVNSRFANAALEFQRGFNRTYLDFYVNGFIDADVKVIRNATQGAKEGSKEGSQDIDEHLRRFMTGECKIDRFALLNFAMSPKKDLVLPKNKDNHNRVYTYQHSTNSLYRGMELIRAPAVAKLPCPSPLASRTSRSYCTVVVRPARPARPAVATVQPVHLLVQGLVRRIIML